MKIATVIEKIRRLPVVLMAAAVAVGCSSIDCPMNSKVTAKYAFYLPSGAPAKVTDTLYVSTVGRDGKEVILINRQLNTQDMLLPMSYNAATDTLLLTVKDTVTTYRDYIYVTKTNDMHLESVECGAVFFHQITAVSSTHSFIDTVVVANKSVNYDSSQEHLRIYLR